MGHLVTSVTPLPLQDGGLGRLVDLFAQFLTDITNLESIPLQLIAFGLPLGGIYALTALGLTAIFGVVDVINLTHDIFLVVGMYSVWLVSEMAGISPFPGIPIAAAVLFAPGVVVRILAVGPIIEIPQQNRLITALGALFIIQPAIEIMFTLGPQQVELSLGSVQVGGTFISLGQFYTPVVTLRTMLAVRTLPSRTDLGRKIRDAADNRDGARYVGISVHRVNHLTLGIGAALAGVVSGSIALFQRFDPFTDETYLISALVIIILDGLGSFLGTPVDGLIVGMTQVFGGYCLPGTTAQVLVSLLFIGTLFIKPEGLPRGAEA